MEYCTIEDVMVMLKEDTYNILLADQYLEDEGEIKKAIRKITQAAIEDADAEINGYVAKRYPLPFPENPPILVKFAKDIALYNIMSRIGIDEGDRDKTYLTRYNAAIRFLEQVGRGSIELGVHEPQTRAENGFSIHSPQRVFSRDSLRGW